ncbi:hypothetical protein [Geminocystis sp. NIES-3709]|uniref:hypothetical protein n=1 Tax=Geminocystis sp. NIES-3709 TaxID=1617448 RepID=UPI0005FC72EA|nr:hypothetical protein [Geminocystis sp. NIES-3709]BAQ63903.1 hypothetical protein GM3709_668 [Geminocystis sp. NIES-3709]
MLTAESKEELYSLLTHRLDVSRTSVIKRLNKLNIKVKKDNEKSWIEDKELDLLDQLNDFVANGGTMDQFLAENNIAIATVEKKSNEIKLEEEPVNIYTSDGIIPQIAQLMGIAQERAGGILIAERVMTTQYLANPELLNDEIKARISHYEEKCVPAAIDAEEFAQKLISEFTE